MANFQRLLDFPSAVPRRAVPAPAGHRHEVAGLFAGIGGIERGLHVAGHSTRLLCENDAAASRVLTARFPGIPLHEDVSTLTRLPSAVTLVAAGFPCQDLSQAGRTAGIGGGRSGLVAEVFRLVRAHRTPWLLLENVPFMLQLGRGRAMEVIVSELEAMGYRWAYRVVDSRSFGLPQRRRRVYLVASLKEDPRHVLFADDAEDSTADEEREYHPGVACGFYWTEGVRGLGWAADAVPTLKGGSTIGIPSAPAILLPNGMIVTPDIRDAERLQGFPSDWTKPAEDVAKRGTRWKLVGNAVSVPAAEWVGKRMARPRSLLDFPVRPLASHRTWPTAAWNVGSGRFEVIAGEWPMRRLPKPLAEFLRYPGKPLSPRATAGFLARAQRARLNFPRGFLTAVSSHLARVSGGVAPELAHGDPAVAPPLAI